MILFSYFQFCHKSPEHSVPFLGSLGTAGVCCRPASSVNFFHISRAANLRSAHSAPLSASKGAAVQFESDLEPVNSCVPAQGAKQSGEDRRVPLQENWEELGFESNLDRLKSGPLYRAQAARADDIV